MANEKAPQIYGLLAEIARKVTAIPKSEKNAQQGYSYRGIASVTAMLHPLLAEHGVVVLPEVLEQERREIATRAGGTLYVSLLRVRFSFVAPDGSNTYVITMGEGMDSGDKASNKAMTAAQKYALTMAFTIPFADQTEGDGERPEYADPPAATRAAASPPKQQPAATAPQQPKPDAAAAPQRVDDGHGISEGKAKRAIAIAINTGEREGVHGFEVLGSVLKAAGVATWAGRGSSETVVSHLCAVIPWRGKSYDNLITAIERWSPDGAEQPPDDEPPPLTDDDIPF